MKLVIVSNRLPVSLTEEEGRLEFAQSPGGLASGLRTYLDSPRSAVGAGYAWVGWPGRAVEPERQAEVTRRCREEFSARPVFLSAEDTEGFYEGLLQPDALAAVPLLPRARLVRRGPLGDLRTHQRSVLRRGPGGGRTGRPRLGPRLPLPAAAGDAQAAPARPEGRLLPAHPLPVLRAVPPPARPLEIARCWRGCSGPTSSGSIPTTTPSTSSSASAAFSAMTTRWAGSCSPTGCLGPTTFPMGIEFEAFSARGAEPEVTGKRDELRGTIGGGKAVLSIDRLDYSKGIANRLLAYRAFLEANPDWRGRVVLLMVVVPSRTGVEDYQRMKSRIDELVGAVNGTFGSLAWTPVLYQYRSFPQEELVPLYGASDVMLVTPLRDGMNLVAKEYVASRADGRGVLILSEMTGAASELGEAVLVNPNDIPEMARAIATALEMPEEEQARRMTALRDRLRRYDVVRWAGDFLEALGEDRSRLDRRMLSPATPRADRPRVPVGRPPPAAAGLRRHSDLPSSRRRSRPRRVPGCWRRSAGWPGWATWSSSAAVPARRSTPGWGDSTWRWWPSTGPGSASGAGIGP